MRYWRRYGGPSFEVDGYLRREGLITEMYDPTNRSWVPTSGAYLDRVIAQGDPMYEPITEDEATAATAALPTLTPL